MSGVALRRTLAAALLLGTVPLGSATAQTSDPRLNQGPKKEAIGDRVMVSTQLPIVTEGALEVLRNGGNAVDAMITAVFLQHVNDYHQVSHFGTMSAIYYEAAADRYHVISAVSERPDAAACVPGTDASAVAIGGVIRGLEALWRRFGTMEWAEYLEPAIRSAEDGVMVSSFMYGTNYSGMQTGSAGSLVANAEARDFYMPDGHLVPVGERWRMPALAAHLRALAAEGPDYMYTGGWGQKFVERSTQRGFCVTLDDMAAYEARWQEPVRFTYRGYELFGSAPPDEGGAAVGFAMKILENFDLKASGHYADSPRTMELMARTFGRVEQETRWAIRDPLAFHVPLELWTSDEYARMAARYVERTALLPNVSVAAGSRAAAGAEAPAEPVVLGSNHNVIVDGEGNWFSMLHTGHGGAPGIFIDGVRATGSGARAETAGPGRRLVLPITAIMIARPGERGPWLAMGTPGSPPQPVTQVLVNMLDFGMHPGAAAEAPRFWAFRGNGEPRVEVESRISDEVRSSLKASGIKVQDLGPFYWSTGSMQIIWRDAVTGRLHGVTDPRRLGWAEGF
jgi:gamma-glutamyltranspeptidase / glutathione hydrolase